jgi:hypothetical protein
MNKIRLWVVTKFDKSIKYGLNKSRQDGYDEAIKDFKRKYQNKITTLQYQHQTEIMIKDAEIKRPANKIELDKKIAEKTLKLRYRLKRKYVQCDYFVENFYQRVSSFLNKNSEAAGCLMGVADEMKNFIEKDKKLLEIQ